MEQLGNVNEVTVEGVMEVLTVDLAERCNDKLRGSWYFMKYAGRIGGPLWEKAEIVLVSNVRFEGNHLRYDFEGQSRNEDKEIGDDKVKIYDLDGQNSDMLFVWASRNGVDKYGRRFIKIKDDGEKYQRIG